MRHTPDSINTEIVLGCRATFEERLVHLADMVQEVFQLEPPYGKTTLSLAVDAITTECYSRVLVVATANDSVLETVVYSHEPEDEGGGTTEEQSMIPGVADVSAGLASIGYVAEYPEGEGPAHLQGVPSDAARDPVDPLGESAE